MYERVFVAVGARAPDFTLKDEADRDVSLHGFRNKGKLVLAFVRGVDDAATREQLDYLKDDYERFKLQGADVLAVSAGNVQFNRILHETRRLPFHLLSDPACHVIRLYGLYNEYDRLVGPAMFVLNDAGVIVFMYQSKNPKDIVEDEEIIRALRGDTQTPPGWPGGNDDRD